MRNQMTYELAKKLKNAGFPQKGEYKYGWRGDAGGDFIIHRNDEAIIKDNVSSFSEVDEMLACPTLSELIEACGEGLWSLARHANIWQTNFKDGMAGETAGSTPEEAVANLWLYLNKKN